MDLAQYLQCLTFRLVNPTETPARLLSAASPAARWWGGGLDALNTRLPCENGPMRRRLRSARSLTGGCFALGAIVNRAAAGMADGEAFLSIGVGDGFPLLAAIAGHPDKRCIGVDARARIEFLRRFGRKRTARHDFLHADPLDYLRHEHSGPVGAALLTAASAEETLARYTAVEPFLSENACLLVAGDLSAPLRRALLRHAMSSVNQYRVLLDHGPSGADRFTFGGGLLVLQLLGRNAAAIPDADPARFEPALVAA